MHDAVIVLDSHNHIVDINPAAERLIGYTASEAVGWPLDQIWNYWSEELDLSPHAPSSHKEILLNNNSDCRTFDVSVSPLSDWRGRLMSRIIVLRDISERKRSEEALKENNRRQSMILDAIPDMIYEMDLKGNILYANRFARETMGLRDNDFNGLKLLDFLTQDGVKQANAITKQLMSGKDSLPSSLYHLRTLDQRIVPIESQARLLTNTNGNCTVLGVARDITERYQAEKLLRESEEKYRTLFEESKDVLFIAAPEGRLLDMNAAGVELFGYSSKEEILQINIANDLYVNPRDRDRFRDAIEHAGFVKDYEITLKRKDGRKIIMLVTSTLMKNEQGQVVAYRGILRDITEKKQLEQQLLQAQKMESIGTLAGGIAHDFNNILGGILGYASFMKSKVEPNHPFFNYVDTIEKSAIRASELTAKLLTFARGGKYDVKPIDITRVIGETLDIIGRTLDKSIEIEVKHDKALPTVEADASQIQQILLNLCLNARDAMPAGGKLMIETFLAVFDADYAARFLGAKPGIYVAISVTDNGIGMTEETKQRIFEPFFTTKEKGKGTGLGLSMVYSVAKNHGGFVSVYSELGIGSTFKVYLPASGKPESKPASPREILEGHNELILVVDDEAAIRSLAKDSLEAYGYRVVTTEDGAEALKIYESRKHEIDLVILDMVMPKMGGLEVFLRLKTLNPSVKALLSTGYSQNGKAQEILDSGVMGFIQKPYQLNELLSKLHVVLHAQPALSD
jgi:PAS domain S-box-containing protein